MIEFFNECIQIYKRYIEFLFRFSLSGIPVGYILMACIIMLLIYHYLIGALK